jgi:hypothetical protein
MPAPPASRAISGTPIPSRPCIRVPTGYNSRVRRPRWALAAGYKTKAPPCRADLECQARAVV